MQDTTTCPDESARRRLLIADAEPDEIESFAEHLSECAGCAALVEASLANDPLVASIRAQSTIGAAPAMEETLVERMLKLRQTPSPTLTMEETIDSSPAILREASTEALEFLERPQSPDEIGRLGGYRILKLLGSGGMGMVLQAEDIRLRRKVAMKVMKTEAAAKPGASERFLREAQAAAAIEHPNVVAILHVGEDRDVPYLVMPWLKGKSLEDRLRESAPLELAEAAEFGAQVAMGLAAAHQKGLIHRDIKPANLWLDESGQVKILDFGLARDLSDEVHLTHSGVILGTPSYMSPEQANGEQVDVRCDLFSLGVVLYRMTTGHMPFRTDSTMAALASLAIDTPKNPQSWNSRIPTKLSELIMTLLEKEPAKRPESALEIADLLRSFARASGHSGGCTVELPAPVAARSETPSHGNRGRSRWVAALGWFAALVMMAGTVFYFRTSTGTVRVEINDDSIEAVLTKNGTIFKRGDKANDISVAAGDHTLKVRRGDLEFETKQFVLKTGETTLLKVELLPGKIQVVENDRIIGDGNLPSISPDRRAAEYVISIGGTVKIDDQERERKNVADLPRSAFALTHVDLVDNTKVDDRGLAAFQGCTRLKYLDLGNTRVTDLGLAHLRDCTLLQVLCLWNTQVSDAGLAYFNRCTDLRILLLWDTQVGDVGLSHFAHCSKLDEIRLLRTKVTNAGLTSFKGWKDLTVFDLSDTAVTDAGLVHLSDCRNLRMIGLNDLRVTDAGLAHFKNCIHVTKLFCWNTAVSDKGLEYFKNCTRMSELHIWRTRIGDAGLALFAKCKDLKVVYVHSTSVGDLAMEKLIDCHAIESLDLSRTRVTNLGLAHLTGHVVLQDLHLSDTSISDAGLIHLRGLKNLKKLNLAGAPVSKIGVATLSKAIPDCDITSDAGRFRGGEKIGVDAKPSPTATESDRKAAEFVLSLRGNVRINHQVQDRSEYDDLPRSPFLLTGASLMKLKKADDVGMENFEGCSNLTYVDVGGTNVGDRGVGYLKQSPFLQALFLYDTSIGNEGMSHLKDCRNIRQIRLWRTKITNDGLVHFKNWPKLTHIDLSETAVDDKGLVHLADCKNLIELRLNENRITDAGLANFGNCKQLESIYLWNTPITDAGIAHFKDCTHLKEMHIWKTNVGNVGLSYFKNCKSLKELRAHTTPIGDEGLEHLKDCTELEILDLTNTRITDAGLLHLKGHSKLRELFLNTTAVTDAGLPNFQDMKDLRKLHLLRTNTSSKALEKLRESLPNCLILHDSGRIGAK